MSRLQLGSKFLKGDSHPETSLFSVKFFCQSIAPMVSGELKLQRNKEESQLGDCVTARQLWEPMRLKVINLT